MRRIPFFRAGTHVTSSGHELSFSESDVESVASVYDPSAHEAPIVVGHPSTDAPAFGWVEDVAFSDGLLAAQPHQVHLEFAEMVRDGRFKKVSAKFYKPGSAVHPLGADADSYYLRHIGFLGAEPPAIKGLDAVEFDEGEDELVEVEVAFGESSEPVQAVRRAMNRFFDWVGRNAVPQPPASFAEGSLASVLESGIEDLTSDERSRADIVQDMADAAGIEPGTVNQILRGDIEEVPDERLSGFAEVLDVSMDTMQNARVEFADPDPSLSDPDPSESMDDNDKIDEREEQLTEREKKLEEREQRIRERERQQKREEALSFAEEHIAKVTPAHKKTLVETLLTLDDAEEATVEFGEGDDAEEKGVGEAFREFVKALPDQIEFSEQTAPEDDDEALSKEDPEYAQKLTERALEFKEEKAKKGQTVTIDEAVAAVKDEFE